MQRKADDAAVAFSAYAERIVAGKDGADDDLAGCLVREHTDGNLDTAELAGSITTLIGAAFHSTRNHIASGTYELLRHPDQFNRLQADPALVPQATEELLRYHPPVQLSMPRLATTDVVMGDVTIRSGEMVAGLISGANRDPARFSDRDRLDITRDEGASIAFASGIHSCIGMVMARMEAQIAIGRFVQRFPSARLVDEEPPIDLRALSLTRGYAEVRVEL